MSYHDRLGKGELSRHKNREWQNYSETFYACMQSQTGITYPLDPVAKGAAWAWQPMAAPHCIARSRSHPPTLILHAHSCSHHLNLRQFPSPCSNAMRTLTQGTAAVASNAKLWGNSDTQCHAKTYPMCCICATSVESLKLKRYGYNMFKHHLW